MAVAAPSKQSTNNVKKSYVSDLVIPRLEQHFTAFPIVGTSPYMQLRFSEKAMKKMRTTQESGTQARSKKTRQARDFTDDYEQAMHRFADGRHGIPCAAFRNAMISACRIVGFKMTIAKMSVFVEEDGEDQLDGTPLVELRGDPEQSILPVRNATGVADLRVRPLWRAWEATLKVRWDAAQFSQQDVLNLLYRAGQQVGVGEGRPDSRNSPGLGYGLFTVTGQGIDFVVEDE